MCLGCFNSKLIAQQGYTLTPRVIMSSRISTQELVNVNIYCNFTETLKVFLEAEIFDSRGRSIIRLKSTDFEITHGFNLINGQVEQLDYRVNGFGEYEMMFGTLPSGIYKVCYALKCAESNCNKNGQNPLFLELPECSDITIDPPNPLILSFPEDHANIETIRPSYYWIAPQPLAAVPDFSYTVTIFKLNPNQKCEEAVFQNPPLYKEIGLTQNFMNYPIEMESLDTGVIHCWKVDGILSGVQVAQSEIWQYELKKDTNKKEIPEPVSYLEIQKQDAQTIFKTTGLIRFKYSSRKSSFQLSCDVKLLKNNKQIPIKRIEYSGVSGENYYQLDVADNSRIKDGDILELTVIEKNNKYVVAYQFLSK